MRALKLCAKRFLPTPVLNAARKYGASARLCVVPREHLGACRARSLTSESLGVALHHPSFKEAYTKDQNDIARVFPEKDIEGGINPGDRQALYHLLAHFKPSSVLEVGTHIGASTLTIAKALESYAPPDASLTTIDILDVNAPNAAWKNLGLPHSPQNALAHLGLKHRVRFVHAPVLSALSKTTQLYDFIFLDGDHRAAAVYREIIAALNHLAEGGVLLLHDVYPKGQKLYPDGAVIYGPWQAVDRVLRENKALVCLPLGALPWPTKAGTRETTLALVSRCVS